MAKLVIPHIEWHLAHSCNFTCESCAHFSNHGHSGIVSKETLIEWYSNWNQRLLPREIDLLGGEPLLNKEVLDILLTTKQMWPDSQIRLITNGILLSKFPNLPRILKETNTVLVISMHSDHADYLHKMSKVFNLIDTWKREFNIDVKTVDSYNNWSKLYKGYGNNIEPYTDNDPEQSWNNCITGQDCFQLYEGNIYKCSPLAYLKLQKQKYKLSSKWDLYLNYEPLRPTASDNEVEEFFNKKAEQYCGMCPSRPTSFLKNNPLMSRKFYRIKQQ